MIEIDTIQGKDVFQVERTSIVNPEDVSVLDPTPTRALTLVTCYPFYFVGSAPQRFIVRAVRVAPRARAGALPLLFPVSSQTLAESVQEWREPHDTCNNSVALAAAIVCVTAGVSQAQQTSTTSETKSFEVLAVDGNTLVVRLPEGTRELTVADDFRFIVNGQPLSVRELKTGMKGTATITTKTTVTPVTVTEVKSGTVVVRSSANIIVRTPREIQSFTQGEVDKRGIKIIRNGKPVQMSKLREGDQLSATFITSAPPRVMTEQEVRATVPAAAATAGGARRRRRRRLRRPPSQRLRRVVNREAAVVDRNAAVVNGTTQSASAAPSQSARTLPKTASSWPWVALASILLLVVGLSLTVMRRLAR